jgi:hypothetical protein
MDLAKAALSESEAPYHQIPCSRTGQSSEPSCNGHIIPPGCPAPWSPLSPSACQLLSPQFAAPGHRFTTKESRQSHYGIPAQRQFFSAVPLGMYAQHAVGTPPGTSPPQASFVTAHHHQMMNAVRGSPGSLQYQQAASLGSMQYASPAQSDASARLGVQLSPGLLQPGQSPRGETVPTTGIQMIPGSVQDPIGGAHL